MYFPTKFTAGRWETALRGFNPENVHLTTEDGTRIHGWFIPGENASLTLLYFHGNGGNITDRIEKLELLHSTDVSIFIIDYRGYGRSEGRPSEAGLYSDADAAYSYLCQEKGVPPHDIVLYGASLGGAVAVDLAPRRPDAVQSGKST